MATAPQVGGPNNPNAGIYEAARKSAIKEIPTAYGRAEALGERTPSPDMITHVPTQEELVAEKKEKFDSELTEMNSGLKSVSEYTVPHAGVEHLEHARKQLAEYLNSLDNIIEAKKSGQY
jgi:hypothetical protein